MWRRGVLAALAALPLAGCSTLTESGVSTTQTQTYTTTRTDATTQQSTTERAGATSISPPDKPDAARGYGFTHVRPDGNRWVGGHADLEAVAPVDVSLDVTPAWVVGLPAPGGGLWTVVGEDGAATAFLLGDGDPEPVPVTPDSLHHRTPPLVVRDGEGVRLVTGPADDAAVQSHPYPVRDGLVYVATDGDIVLQREGERDRIDVGAPPDTRIVGAGESRVAALGDATTEYGHGALGDATEGGSLVLASVEDGLSVAVRVPAGRDDVIEGIAPIVGGVTGGETPDAVVTESDADAGAAVVAYGPDGERARGPAAGRRFRWRHQVAVAPFAPDGTSEVAAVKTPHLGGVAEFYRADGEGLTVAATVEGGYRSHDFGSRNLDGAVAADADGDGRPELVVPTRERGALAVVERTASGARESGRLPVGGRLSTNLGATRLPGSGLALAAGRTDGVRVWATRS